MQTQPGYLDPSCPRCGYDQSGEAATWESACPIEGTCPECGHGFAWADLFDPSRQDVAWSVESGETRRARLLKTPGMAARMVLPWIYWKRVGVDMPLRIGRLWSWLVWVAVVCQVIVWPFVFLGLGLMHIRTWPVAVSDIGKIFSDLSFGQQGALAASAVGWPVIWFGIDWTGPRFLAFELDDESLLFVRFVVGVIATWCVVLTALPVTRRLAKLRRGHIARAALIQLACLALYIALIRVAYVSYLVWYADWIRIVVVIGSLIAAVWCLVWWAAALRVGWSIRSPLLLVLGTTAAFLGGLVAIFIYDSIWYLFRY